MVSKRFLTFFTLLCVLPSWHTSTWTCSINVVTGFIIQTVPTLKHTSLSIISTITFLKRKRTKKKTKTKKQKFKNEQHLYKQIKKKRRCIVFWIFRRYAISWLFFFPILSLTKIANYHWYKEENLRSSHLAFWKPSAHLLQFPKKGSQTSLL